MTLRVPRRIRNTQSVFSSKPINPANAQTATFTDAFTGNDPIYALVTFNEPLKSENVLGDAYSDRIKQIAIGLCVNEDPNFPGVNAGSHAFNVTSQEANGNSYVFVIIPQNLPNKDDYDALDKTLMKNFVETVLAQHKYRNARRFDVRVIVGTPESLVTEGKNLSTGSHFTLDLSNGIGRYKEIVTKYDITP